MAWSDLETIIGSLGTIFGNTQASGYIIGSIVFMFFLYLGIVLNIGFEATTLFLTALLYAEIQAGILPEALMIIVYLGGGAVILSLLLSILRR